jgi:endonuclease/exonuclease/phosphatase (EEP) superfamily protein YafD
VPGLFSASSISASRPAGTLRIYTLNTWDAHPDPARLEHALAALDADVLVLSEIEPAKRALIKRLARRFAHEISCADRTECAMVLLSRLPVLAGGAERKRYDTPPVVWARIDASARGGGTLTVVGTHVHRPTRDPVIHRRQMRMLAAMVAATPGPRLLVGDLNTSPFSASFRELGATTGLRPTTSLVPTWPMWPVRLPQLAIDHMLASAELDIVDAGRGAAVGSDHAPLFADIRVRVTPDVPRADAGRPSAP